MNQIKEGAIFVADAHYPHHGEAFITLLRAIEQEEITPPQLFLMGDNFDLLFGYNRYIVGYNQEAIDLLQNISKRITCYYFEGNHDFCLKEIFPSMEVFSRAMQPVIFSLGNKRVGLSHGDRYATSWGYNLYSTLLRSPITLLLLRPFERLIIDHRLNKLSQKSICHHFEGFEKRVERILQYYQGVDMVIEGHFHQAKRHAHYISLPSLACQGEVGIVRESQILFEAMA
jgi:UDP-2,3-diacylglucosamine hydrolase